jgi:hypothetical protein
MNPSSLWAKLADSVGPLDCRDEQVCIQFLCCNVLGTTSVQLSERKGSLLTPKRHQLKQLEFVLR